MKYFQKLQLIRLVNFKFSFCNNTGAALGGIILVIAAKLLKSFGRAVKLLKKEGKGGKKKGIQI